MKIIIIALSAFVSLSSYAGNWVYSCSNKDHTVTLTRDKLVLISKNKTFKNEEVDVYESDGVNQGIEKDVTLTYSDKAVAITANKVSPSITVASEQYPCPDTPANVNRAGIGFESVGFNVSATLKVNNTKQAIELSCVESQSWNGHCIFED